MVFLYLILGFFDMTLQNANKHLELKDYYSAELAYKNLLKENINNLDAMLGLGKVALAQNHYKRAYDLFVRCLHINAKIFDIYLYLAQACSLLTRFDKEEQALLTAYQLNPNSTKVLYALAIFYCESGDHEKSEDYIHELLKGDKDSILAFALLVRMKKVSLNQLNTSLIVQYEKVFKAKNLSINDEILLTYCFADLHHLAKDYSQAIEYYKAANRLQKQLVDFSVSDLQPSIKLLIKAFDASFVQSFSSIRPNESELISKINITPIFIVGQPRSGSTLLEQMLIGHTDIASAGELPHLGDDLVKAVAQINSEGFPLGCQSLKQEHCMALALHYLNTLRDISGVGYKYVVDKMPANYQFIGFIKLLLPHAKIIHITRNPRDVSWSIFKNNFAAAEPHFCSQNEIGQYHKLYTEVMLHWKKVLPDDVYDIEYEKLVDSPEAEIKQILAYCGLTFEQDCLNFSSAKRVIKTLSDTQLREGIQKRAVPEWLPYEKELTQMFDLLD